MRLFQTVWSLNVLSLQTRRLSNVPTFSFSLHIWMVVAEVSMAVCVSLRWLQLKNQLISHCERAVGRPQWRITLSPLMAAGDSWSSALTVVKQGLFQTSHLFCLKAHLFYPKAMLWKTSLMMIVIPSGLRCWDDPSSPVRCLSVTYSLTPRANAAYWSQKTHLT